LGETLQQQKPFKKVISLMQLAIDIETYSSNEIKNTGVYKYVEAPDFEILLFGYSLDGRPVEVVDMAQGEHLPLEIENALTNPSIIKCAFNANFERTALNKYFKLKLPVDQWQCTAVHASMLGLPLNLETVARVLNLTEQKGNGKPLIRYFSMPCKPTKANGGRTRNLPQHDPVKWQQFKDYCAQDVVAEQAIKNKISFFEIPPVEKRLWHLDQQINDTGVLVDPELVKNAISMEGIYKEKLTTEAIKLTGLSNPNSVSQLKEWLTKEMPLDDIDTLKKTDIPELLTKVDGYIGADTIKRVLNIRQEMSKTSVKKYAAMVKSKCSDNRIRGLFQYYGANRTGRFAGRIVQMQNLPRNEMKDLDLAREVVKRNDLELLQMLYGNVPDTLSQLIRTAFIPEPGNRLIISDLSAIEARIIAWLSGERWKLDVFNTHGKIYEATAAHMFKIPIEKVTKTSEWRHKAKIAELALGYQGGPNALIAMGALRMGLVEEELPKLVKMWRNANRKICSYWYQVGEAANTCVQTGQTIVLNHGVKMLKEKGIFFIQLPSGRRLCYLKPSTRPNAFNGYTLIYEGMNQTTKQWGKQNTYGGKLVENIVQAVARDVLATAMLRLHDKGYKIIAHIHDEIVMEMPLGVGSLDEVNQIMSMPISWAKGLPLAADGFETMYYKKD
jgi:DNA polymerase bacteriophage-type